MNTIKYLPASIDQLRLPACPASFPAMLAMTEAEAELLVVPDGSIRDSIIGNCNVELSCVGKSWFPAP